MTDFQTRPITFRAQDGWALAGDLFLPAAPRTAVLISAGTGFPRRFYRHLAAWLATRGATVLTYDYRGIGDSVGPDIRTSGIDYPHWGRFDMPAAVDTLAEFAPGLPLTHVAHSVGGHFLGLMPNHGAISRHAFVSVGTGYFGGHHRSYLPLEFYFWWVMGSYSLLRHRHIKRGGGWQGEPLPPALFRTWRRWAHHRDYFGSELGTVLRPQHYDQVTEPIRSWVFTDDPIATPRSARHLLESYPNAPHNVTLNRPGDYGLRRIGHDGAFRPGLEPLWRDIWIWLGGDAA
ncbi:serine aminopeptidase domain-containing protein [Thalassovita sp.]|uniref:alpha/beta hydrolase family protein n=1 Tax=Thalassovita sp. TaxID=1979401 RepID=UPI0029DE88E4|nr:alpha/beta hydrolase [Thalassovita sp.]